jgi:hypothetical protein
MRKIVFIVLLLIQSGICTFGSDEGLVAWWKFDTAKDDKTLESIRGSDNSIVGNFKMVKGVSGSALRLDGLTSYIVCEPEKAPEIPDAFSLEAWVALGAYPLNWCPIVGRYRSQKGFYLGIGDKGQVGLHLAVDGQWTELTSEANLELRKWYHIAGVLDPTKGLTVYINGKQAAKLDTTGYLTPASNMAPMLIGKYPFQVKPTGGVRRDSHMGTNIFFDGIFDELKITGKALNADKIAAEFAENCPKDKPDLPMRVLPAGPEGTMPFGAFYTTLKYYEQWDALWRVGDSADVVVAFDQAPYRFVFWRGTSYIPHWVTENGIWYNNEFNETWGHGVAGCAEPMSDKQCRHSHVRIIESHDARVVVHWRYALVDNYYNFARVDKDTHWGDWTDETYTIYPDGVGIREITLHSTAPAEPHEWQEGIIVMGPGQYPEGVLETEALTLANIDGESHTYSWAERAPRRLDEPKNANIHLVNTKSKYRTFAVVTPESSPSITAYGGEIRREISIFPWWNHWPTSQNPSDGRYAMAADRAAHSSLTHIEWKEHSKTENTMTKIMLHGMTNKSAGQLAPLARSWAWPASLNIEGDDFLNKGYDQTERAYILEAKRAGKNDVLTFELDANEKSPVVNPAFVINNWGRADAKLSVNGKSIKRGRNFRLGHRHRLGNSDLIIWLEMDSFKPIRISVSPAQEN